MCLRSRPTNKSPRSVDDHPVDPLSASDQRMTENCASYRKGKYNEGEQVAISVASSSRLRERLLHVSVGVADHRTVPCEKCTRISMARRGLGRVWVFGGDYWWWVHMPTAHLAAAGTWRVRARLSRLMSGETSLGERGRTKVPRSTTYQIAQRRQPHVHACTVGLNNT